MSTIGRTIAAARENAGFTLADLSARTCIRRQVLAGIENDDFRACGGDFYARGHIRAVCRELGIDPAELIERYDSEHSQKRAVPAFTDNPVTGRGDEAERGADERGGSARPRTAGGAQDVPRAREEDSEPAPPNERPADAHAAAGAAQPSGGSSPTAESTRQVREHRGSHSRPRRPDPAAAGAYPAPRARHSRPEEGSQGEAAAAGASGEGEKPEPRRERKTSFLAATIAAARRSWPLLVFVAIAGAAVATALVAWPEDRAGQSAGAGGLVERDDQAALPGTMPTDRQETIREPGRNESGGDRAAGDESGGDGAVVNEPGGDGAFRDESGGDASGGDGVGRDAPGGDEANPDEAAIGTRLSGATRSERKAEEVHLTVSALERVWVRVTDAEGDNRFTGTLERGDVRAWIHPDELRLHVGKASAVRITVNDEHIGRPDSKSRVDRYTFSATDLA